MMEPAALLESFCPGCEQEEQDRLAMLQYCRIFPDLLTRKNAMAHFTASCWIVNSERSHVLMAYHNIYQSWSWLGGHTDGEADLLRVSMKEAAEESGLTAITPLSDRPISLEILGVDGHRKRGVYVSPHLHLNLTYLLECDNEAVLHIREDENSGLRWFPSGEVLSHVSESKMRPIYEKLLKRMTEY